jgi:V/A-type H+-transporting ATPase subunit C
MEEFTRNLKDTPYYPLFGRIQSSGSITPFDYEMRLDIYYFNKSWHMKDKLMKGDNLKAVEKLYGTQIDLLNIMWIYRLKTMYETNISDILTFTIPVNYKLPKEQLLRLIKSVTTEEFLSILKNTYYKAFAASLLNGTMENSYNKTVMKLYKDNKQKYPASMSYVNYYLYMKETEIHRLTTALECIRYKLEPQEKLKYILHEDEPSHHLFPMEAMKRGEVID